jgi:hypothetical protein
LPKTRNANRVGTALASTHPVPAASSRRCVAGYPACIGLIPARSSFLALIMSAVMISASTAIPADT